MFSELSDSVCNRKSDSDRRQQFCRIQNFQGNGCPSSGHRLPGSVRCSPRCTPVRNDFHRSDEWFGEIADRKVANKIDNFNKKGQGRGGPSVGGQVPISRLLLQPNRANRLDLTFPRPAKAHPGRGIGLRSSLPRSRLLGETHLGHVLQLPFPGGGGSRSGRGELLALA